MKKIIVTLCSVMMVFLASCGSTSQVRESSATAEKSSSKESKSDKNLYKGAGLVIAVTSPQIRNASQNSAWIPQFFQDSLTGNFARYSKMTVLDRSNENLIKAEQELSESGFYTEENAVQIGQMTNAALVVVGTIQQISGTYELNFRVNDVTTNEIKASSNGRYSLSEIENGKAINEVTQNLLEVLGIGFTDEEKSALRKSNSTELKSAQNLAKGAVAEKSNDFISALDFYAQVNGSQKNEATHNTHLILNGSIPTGSISEKAAYYKSQTEKWNKIFEALRPYLAREIPVFVYDFSTVKDEINVKQNSVKLTVAQGVKVVPKRTAVIVWKEIMDAWRAILADKENDVWSKAVQMPYMSSATTQSRYDLSYEYKISCNLYDKDGNILAKCNPSVHIFIPYYYRDKYGHDLQSQKKYFDDAKFVKVTFSNVSLDDITENLETKIESIQCDVNVGSPAPAGTKWFDVKNLVVLSLAEWNEFTKN